MMRCLGSPCVVVEKTLDSASPGYNALWKNLGTLLNFSDSPFTYQKMQMKVSGECAVPYSVPGG